MKSPQKNIFVLDDELFFIYLIFAAFIVLILLLIWFVKINVYHHIILGLIFTLLIMLFYTISHNRKLSLKIDFLNKIYIDILAKLTGISEYRDLFSNIINIFIENGVIFSGTGYIFNKNKKVLKIEFTLINSEVYKENAVILYEEFIGRHCIDNKQLYFIKLEDAPKLCSYSSAHLTLKNFYIYYFPVIYKDEVVGILEVLAIKEIKKDVANLIEKIMTQLGIAIMYIKKSKQVYDLATELEEKNKILITQNKELQAQSEELEAQTEELNAQKAELEEMNRKLKELESYKSEFLANMAHELRTPLNSIIGLSELLLRQTQNNGVLKEKIEVIYTSGKQLLNIINDILDLTKIEAGKLELKAEEFSLDEVLNYVKKIILPQCKEKGLDLYVYNKVKEDILYHDKYKLVQILLNLLSNAVKYTEKGYIKINVYEIENSRIRIDVTDTGIGIDKSLVDDIFEPFHRLESKKYIQGTGLGLPLTKKLLTLMGGSIWVKSKINQGTTFSVVLPKRYLDKKEEKINDEKKIKDLEDKIKEAPLTHLTFMVVDDDFLSVRELVSLIREVNDKAKIFTAYNGKEAIDILNKNKDINIIFLDLNMPELDGYQFLKYMKDREIHSNVIIVTSMDIEESLLDEYGDLIKSIFIKGKDTKYYLKSIIEKFIEKSPEKREIKQITDKQLSLFERPEEQILLKSPETEIKFEEKESSKEPEAVEGQKKILLAEDNIANRFLIKELLSEFNVRLDEAGDGLEALKCLEKERYDLILMDIQMPKMDGYETLYHIKRNKNLKDIPVIALTAKLFKKDIEKMKEMGFYDVILKPISLEEFYQKLKKVLPDLKQKEK